MAPAWVERMAAYSSQNFRTAHLAFASTASAMSSSRSSGRASRARPGYAPGVRDAIHANCTMNLGADEVRFPSRFFRFGRMACRSSRSPAVRAQNERPSRTLAPIDSDDTSAVSLVTATPRAASRIASAVKRSPEGDRLTLADQDPSGQRALPRRPHRKARDLADRFGEAEVSSRQCPAAGNRGLADVVDPCSRSFSVHVAHVSRSRICSRAFVLLMPLRVCSRSSRLGTPHGVGRPDFISQ